MEETLLLKYYSNELNAREKEAIEEWICASPQNKQTALEYYQLTLAINSKKYTKNTKIAINNVLKKKKKKFPFRVLQRIAAILILPLIGAFIYSTIDSPVQVNYMEAKTSVGMTGYITLPDGSEVWLNSNTYIKYPTIFTDKNRTIELDGEAYFSVKKDNKRKFIVTTEHSTVEVLGTEFNLDAYSDSKYVVSNLYTGSLKQTYDDINNTERSVTLVPNQELSYNVLTHETTMRQMTSNRQISWKDGQIILRDTNLRDVLWTLSKRFNVDFVVDDPTLFDNSFTGTFKNQSLEYILQHFKISSHIQYKIDYSADNSINQRRTQVELFITK